LVAGLFKELGLLKLGVTQLWHKPTMYGTSRMVTVHHPHWTQRAVFHAAFNVKNNSDLCLWHGSHMSSTSLSDCGREAYWLANRSQSLQRFCLFLFLFWSTRVWSEGLSLVRQGTVPLEPHNLAHFALVYFFR
jgi:hypothetical protein